ncbi:DUF551 domain-containing protein [Klebsiella pneumoniae]|nr:DUF551 domain-containing protein [Klebsiella pneumoniae]
MSEFSRETLLNIIETDHVQCGEASALARMALAAMDSEPVIVVGDDGGDALSYRRLIQSFEPGTKLYRHAQPLPVVNGEYGDAYQGAREDLAIWKRRALEAEESVRRLEQINDHLVKEAQGESRMGEPVIAQPAPVVPEEATPDSIEILASARPRDHAVFQWNEDQRNAAADSWNACRAAMLQDGTLTNEGTSLQDNHSVDDTEKVNSPLILDGSASMLRRWLAFGRGMQNAGCQQPHNLIAETESMLAVAPQPQNAPQNIPEIISGWIPVSERMPEDEQEVLTINKMGHRFVSFFDKHSGLFFDRLDAPAACCIEHVLVTHWMPLPAATQEVIHG